MSFNAPKPPDPAQTIKAQQDANTKSAVQTAALDRINQNTPYGSISYSTNGVDANGIPIYTQNQTLSPEQQKLYESNVAGQQGLADTANQSLGNVKNTYQSPLDTSGIPKLKSGVGGNFDEAYKTASDADYKHSTDYLDPQFKQSEDEMNTRLVNQGLQPGTEAYDKAYGNLQRSKQAAYESARTSASEHGLAAQQQGFGQALSDAELNNQSSAQGLSQLFAMRQNPLNEYNALRTGSQVTNPTFQGYANPQIANTDASGIINTGYQNKLAYQNARNAPLFALADIGGKVGAAYAGAH